MLKCDALIPKFLQVYELKVINKGMICSCKFHECNGIPCQHSDHVLKSHYVGWAGYSKYDV